MTLEEPRPFFAMSREESLTLRRTGMGIVFQSFGLLPTLSAAENVELPLRVGGVDLDEARERSPALARARRVWPTASTTVRSSCRPASSSAWAVARV